MSILTDTFSREFGRAPQACGVAPGRIEFIGNHTDYNGGLVMGVAIDRTISVAVSRNGRNVARLHSAETSSRVELPVGEFVRQSGSAAWTNYPMGVLASLKEEGLDVPEGFDFHVESNVPLGAGLSSSAAFELATARALCALYGMELDRKQLAVVGRRAENKYVGIPSGILDQGVSAFGGRDKVVRIDCAKLDFQQIPMPEGLHFWIFNSNHKHSLVDSLYAARHNECMTAVEAIAKHKRISCLAELVPADLAQFESVLDPVVYKRARHVVEENDRVRQMGVAMQNKDLAEIGRLLYASHASSRDLFENSIPAIDAIVEILGETDNVVGARLTGGGFGGAAMAVTTGDFNEAQAQEVASRYREKIPGGEPTIFHTQTGDGARLL